MSVGSIPTTQRFSVKADPVGETITFSTNKAFDLAPTTLTIPYPVILQTAAQMLVQMAAKMRHDLQVEQGGQCASCGGPIEIKGTGAPGNPIDLTRDP